MRIAFMGTPDFALPTFQALIDAGHEIVAVYTQPPRPAGRGKKLQKSPVHLLAEEKGFPVYTPASMKAEEEIKTFAALDLDIAVVIAYGQILPQAVLDAPRFGCVNVHASLLPRWRGAAPIQRAVMAGDAKTGVCIMQMEAGLDTGPVLMCAETEITEVDTASSMHDRLAEMGGEMIIRALEGIEVGALTAEPQPEEGVTYARKIEKTEAKIDWAVPAADVAAKVRGLAPFPGAWTEVAGERLKLLAGHLEEGATGTAGQVLDDELLIACGAGAYRIDRAQRAGKAAMDRADLLRGFQVPVGTSFS